MNNLVYIMHVYSNTVTDREHSNFSKYINDIKTLNPKHLIIWSDTEYDVNFIFDKFFTQIDPWLKTNNKHITVVAPGFDRNITDNISVVGSYGYHIMGREVLTTLMDVDVNNVHLQSDKLFTLYCNRGSKERVQIIDTVAREDLLSSGIVTFKSAYFGKEMHDWKYYDGSRLYDEDDYDATNPNYAPNYFPKSFFRGMIDIVCESRVDDNEYFPTEKTMKSLAAQKPFLALSCQHYHQYLRDDYGIEMYDEIFDYSFDSKPDIADRIEGIIENIKRVKDMDKNHLHSLILPKLQSNKAKFVNYQHDFNKIFPKALRFLLDGDYEIIGDNIDSFGFWLQLVRKNKWL
jgi:hypothetical protein